MAEPLLAALAARGERLAILALPWVAPVFRAMPQVAEVIEAPFAHGRLDVAARWRLGRSLEGRFDTAFVLGNSWKSALVPFFAAVPRRIGYLGESRFGLLDRRLANPRGRPPMVAHYLALAALHGPGSNGAPADAEPRLAVDEATAQLALEPLALEPGGYWAIAPGAEYGPSKRWPASHVAALASRLAAHDGRPVLLLGSPGERALCEAIAANTLGGTCTVLAGRTSLGDALALVSRARGFVSNDSGLMHVAAALGVPQVAVFGSTSPLHTPPRNVRARVVWLKRELALDCMPCFERTCRYGHHRCMTSIAPERVEAALVATLAAAPAPGTATATAPPTGSSSAPASAPA